MTADTPEDLQSSTDDSSTDDDLELTPSSGAFATVSNPPAAFDGQLDRRVGWMLEHDAEAVDDELAEAMLEVVPFTRSTVSVFVRGTAPDIERVTASATISDPATARRLAAGLLEAADYLEENDE